MYTIAEKLTDYVIQNGNIKDEERSIYVYEAVEKYENMPDAVSSEVVKFDSFEEIEDIVTATAKGTLVCCF